MSRIGGHFHDPAPPPPPPPPGLAASSRPNPAQGPPPAPGSSTSGSESVVLHTGGGTGSAYALLGPAPPANWRLGSQQFGGAAVMVAQPQQWAAIEDEQYVVISPAQHANALRAPLTAVSVEEENQAPSIFDPRRSSLPVLAEQQEQAAQPSLASAQPPPPPAQPGPARGSDDGNPWDGMGPENAAVPYAPREAFFFGGNFCLRRVCTEGAAGGEAMQGLERRARGKGIGGYRGKGLGGYRSLRISNVLGGYRSL